MNELDLGIIQGSTFLEFFQLSGIDKTSILQVKNKKMSKFMPSKKSAKVNFVTYEKERIRKNITTFGWQSLPEEVLQGYPRRKSSGTIGGQAPVLYLSDSSDSS